MFEVKVLRFSCSMQYVSSRGFVIIIMITQVYPSKAHPEKKKYFILSMRIAGHARVLFSRRITIENSVRVKRKRRVVPSLIQGKRLV